MEAPEKIYVQPQFNRIVYTERIKDDFIEYTRTDAFIEKAAEWLKTNAYKHIYFDECNQEWYDTEELINDFKKYMKGE